MKRRGQFGSPFDEEDGTAAFLSKIYRTFKQMMIEAHVWGVFQEVGFELLHAVSPIDFVLRKKNCEQVRGIRKFGRSTSLLRNYQHIAKERGFD
jgi:hypothetical protein